MIAKENISPLGIAAILLLCFLAVSNAAWVIISGHRGSFIALVFYLIVSVLCLRNRHFQAGVIAGTFGFGIHVYELLTRGITELNFVDQVFFFINLIVPIPLTILSFLAVRERQKKHEPIEPFIS
jgi:hypothetical protein